MFDARMLTKLAQRLVSIVSSVFDQTCFNRLVTHFNTLTLACLFTKQCLMVFGRQTFIVCPGPRAFLYLVFRRLQARINGVHVHVLQNINSKYSYSSVQARPCHIS